MLTNTCVYILLLIFRIVCDSWIRLEFPTPETGIRFITKVTLIRAIWDKLLNRRLTGKIL